MSSCICTSEDAERPSNSSVALRVAFTSACLLALFLGYFISPSFYFLSFLAGGWYPAAQTYRELPNGRVSVDSLMLLAALGAALIGEYPEGAFLLFLFTLSGTLESLILGRTRSAIQALIELNPDHATVRRDGLEKRIGIAEVMPGDIVIVRPGERLPVDGQVKQGQSSVDQSPITGESVPVDVAEGDSVLAGTLNLQGALEVTCRSRGEDTTLLRLVRLVEQAQREKSKSETVSRWFGEKYTYFVLILSSMSFLIFLFGMGLDPSTALHRAMTVLVVACPCAIVISVPAAILSGIANAARNGVLIKAGAYLERLASLQALAFDKTGTFTVGRPRVVQLFPLEGVSEEQLLSVAASAESLSEHPLAKAIIRAARERKIAFQSLSVMQSLLGKGIVAKRGEVERVIVGKRKLFEDLGIQLSEAVNDMLRLAQEKGWTTMLVGQNEEILGVVAIADTLRPHAAETIRILRTLGFKKVVMLTGDNQQVAAQVARELDAEYFADLLPEQKLQHLKRLRTEVGSIGMIGDGVNDAPSLAAADVGLTLGGAGSGVALEAADVVLMGDDLRKLASTVRLAQMSKRIILQNLVFAGAVMILLLVASFFRGIPMPIAVVGHEGSTLLVILNGLRLLLMNHEREV